MPLQPNEIARRENGRTELRTTPMRIRWTLDDLVTSDGHRLHCTFTASVNALADAAERRMLEEVFLARAQTVITDDVVRHFNPGLRAAALKIAGKHTAADWLKGDPREAMIGVLKEEANRIAFTAGVEVLQPFHADFESPTFANQQIEEMERTLAERRVAGQVEHFERASRLLKQFESLREAAPDLPPAEILKQISPADQGMMLQTLLLAAGKAKSTACLWAVAGSALVKIDGRATPATLEMTAIPQTLGPLRSVQPARLDGKPVLLIGARSGIIVFDTHSQATTEYADHLIESQLGFSGATVWNDQIWACHGDAGVVAWTIGQTAAPSMVIRPVELRAADNPPPVPVAPSSTMSVRTAGIRNLRPLDDNRLLFSVGHYLTSVNKTGLRAQIAMESQSEIVGIIAEGNRVVIVQDDGTVNFFDRAKLAPVSQTRRTGRVASVATLPWLGTSRLLLATEEGPIYCIGIEDELVTQYLSNHRGLRAISASVDIIAAVSGDRQRVILWNSWDGKKPMAEISIAGATRHRVADIDFS